MSVRPVFVVSLPRSGSTLLQRMLTQHPAVDGTAEPWVALPHLLADSAEDLWTSYHQRIAVRAMREFFEHLPEGRQSYLWSVGRMLTDLYSQAALPGAELFVDKTPRYVQIWEMLLESVPEARIIALARNPIDVAASVLTTWGAGRWNLHRFDNDLDSGLQSLAQAFSTSDPRVFGLRYEDLLVDPIAVMSELSRFLEILYDPAMAAPDTSVRLAGSVGDLGPNRAADSVLKRRPLVGAGHFHTALRRRWVEHYIAQTAASWEVLGYDPGRALASIRGQAQRGLGVRELPRFALGAVYRRFPVPARLAIEDRVRRRLVSPPPRSKPTSKDDGL